jgi:beta-lactamase superfamily II metal-dependent hydrolase
MNKKIILIIFIILFFISTSNNVYSTSSIFKIENELSIHFIDVGQGDCTLIALPGGKTIITHPHDDHIGGIFSIASEYEVSSFHDNGFSNFESTIFGDYIQLVRENLSKYSLLQAGESLSFDDVKIDVLNPLLPPTGNLNEDSVVLKISYMDLNILLLGDLGNLGEKRLLKSGAGLTGQIIKVGHHGDRNVLSSGFINAIKPEIAVISLGKINKYAQPDTGTLNILSKSGVKIYRTDQAGHIIFRTDGRTYSIHTEK